MKINLKISFTEVMRDKPNFVTLTEIYPKGRTFPRLSSAFKCFRKSYYLAKINSLDSFWRISVIHTCGTLLVSRIIFS